MLLLRVSVHATKENIDIKIINGVMFLNLK